jgi:hypothetical protein
VLSMSVNGMLAREKGEKGRREKDREGRETCSRSRRHLRDQERSVYVVDEQDSRNGGVDMARSRKQPRGGGKEREVKDAPAPKTSGERLRGPLMLSSCVCAVRQLHRRKRKGGR